jgi:hypothetical protein
MEMVKKYGTLASRIKKLKKYEIVNFGSIR